MLLLMYYKITIGQSGSRTYSIVQSGGTVLATIATMATEDTVLVNFSHREEKRLGLVKGENGNFPGYGHFIQSAKNLYGIDGQIYFTNDFGTRLQDDAVFSVYIQTYARSPNFALIVNQEEKVGVQNEDTDTGDVPETGIFIDTTEMNDDNDLPKTDTDKKSSEETDVKLNSEVKGKTIQQTQIDGEEKLLKTTVKDLSHLLEAHQLKYILQEYESDGKLKQSSQKTFVYMVSNHIISLAGHYPSKRVKIHMAKLCADLFPSYKRNTENYYELFYDPISKGGLLFSRLNYLRERNLKLTGSGKYKTKKSEEQEQDEPTPSTSSTLTAGEIREAEEHIEFLQHATIAQKEQIIETFKKNKKHRQMNRQSIIQDYKSCITLMPTLLLLDFDSEYGPKDVSDIWTKISPKIDEYYQDNSKRKLQRLDKIITDWAMAVQTTLKLLTFLPPTNADKTRQKGTLIQSLQSLIMFVPEGISRQEIDDKIVEEEVQLQLIAMGSSKKALSKFIIMVDNNFLNCPSNNFFEAFDFFFKIHFSLHLEYNPLTKRLMLFLQHFFYKIKVDKITPNMSLLAAKLGLLKTA